MNKPIYLDYNATTPVDPAVLEAMQPYFQQHFGNAASTSHAYGWEADMAVSKARKQVADLIGAKPREIVFTSGATESNNICIQGIVRPFLRQRKPVHLITTAVEHKCVLDTVNGLKEWGAEVTCLAPDKFGRVQAKDILHAIKPHTKIVSVIFGNNEIGTVNPIGEIGSALKERGVLFHTDAAQAVGKFPLNVKELCIDYLSASSQKMYGPKGVGFLYINKDNTETTLEPIIFGGSQEQGLRPGTLNVPGIVGLGKACEIFAQRMREESERLCKMQKDFIHNVLQIDDSIILNGCPENRLCSNISFTFPNLKADAFAEGLGGLAVSSGSACSAGEPSYVLKAIGHSPDLARKSVRIGIGRFTTKEDLQLALNAIQALVQTYR